ncbi:hypothetical protein SmJEL517_g04693 [Synchytrium microbalum]|uniref:RRM domain-containing protein n=1 Tax=Synchytrium microbalum TaxID=1806994 RepID=A0A507BSX4_9FUNG|nr:uncharacterized protein SmJEL517_g04693 [Synchytrium microbalum]TPX32147.1 hypothetical protein SmJEL517_g04693 [Synchytrium microbalum]
MEVLKGSFDAILPTIAEAIQQADFVAIDTELTGLNNGQSTAYAALDTPQDRYSKLRKSSQQFSITQYGVSCFIWDQKKKSYTSKPFNFYIFPATAKFPFNVFERNWMSQVGSIEFLAKNGFDFNKWIRHGIPYCSKHEESYIKNQINQVSTQPGIAIDDGNREFVETSLDRVDEWLQNSVEKSIDIDTQSSYHKKLIGQQIRQKYNNALGVSLRDRSVQVKRLSDEERDNGVGDQAVQLEKQLDEIYDTKHICKTIPALAPHFPDSSLEKVYKTTLEPPFEAPTIQIHDDHQRYSTTSASYHEAGWDAHATGAAFARLVAQFQQDTKISPRVSFDEDTLLECLNRMNMMRSDLAYVHLNGPDDQPDRSSVLHIFSMPQNYKQKDIEASFDAKEYGSISLQWINSTSAFIRFESTEKSEKALSQHTIASKKADNLNYGDDMEDGEENAKATEAPAYHLQRYTDMMAMADGPTAKISNGGENGDVSGKRKRPAGVPVFYFGISAILYIRLKQFVEKLTGASRADNPDAKSDWSPWPARYKPFEGSEYDVVAVIGSNTTWVNVANPELAKDVAVRKLDFPKPIQWYDILDVYGKNVLTVEGEVWKYMRRIVAPTFSDRNSGLVHQETIKTCKAMFDAWDKSAANGSAEVNVSNDSMKLTMFVISGAGFGLSLDWNREDQAGYENHKLSFKQSAGAFLDVSVLFKINAQFDSYLREFIADAKSGKKMNENNVLRALVVSTGEDDDFTGKAEASDKRVMTEAEIVGNCFIIMLAGHETTYETPGFSTNETLSNQDIQEELHAEVERVLGDRDPKYQDYNELKYCQAVANETLRLFPAVVSIPKWVPKDGKPQHLGKLVVEPGTHVNIHASALHHDLSYTTQPSDYNADKGLGLLSAFSGPLLAAAHNELHADKVVLSRSDIGQIIAFRADMDSATRKHATYKFSSSPKAGTVLAFLDMLASQEEFKGGLVLDSYRQPHEVLCYPDKAASDNDISIMATQSPVLMSGGGSVTIPGTRKRGMTSISENSTTTKNSCNSIDITISRSSEKFLSRPIADVHKVMLLHPSLVLDKPPPAIVSMTLRTTISLPPTKWKRMRTQEHLRKDCKDCSIVKKPRETTAQDYTPARIWYSAHGGHMNDINKKAIDAVMLKLFGILEAMK